MTPRFPNLMQFHRNDRCVADFYVSGDKQACYECDCFGDDCEPPHLKQGAFCPEGSTLQDLKVLEGYW